MMKKWLAATLAILLVVGMISLPVTEASAASTTATVKGGWLRLRAAPNFYADTISSYYTGTVVTVVGSIGDWYQVITPNGRSGYMHGDFLTVKSSSSSGSGSYENIAATVISANGLGVRLRTGPSTAYGVMGLYPVGTSATILTSGSTWHYVRIGSNTGYMMAQFLTTGSVDLPSTGTGYTAYVTSQNGLGVRLRFGPGTGYGIRGVYSVGTQVTVLEHGRTWDYIRIGTRTGYMMTKFLTTTRPGGGSSGSDTTKATVQGVVLNTAYPTPGTVLSASVSPSAATVSYKWMTSAGVVLSTSSTYTVTTGQVGEQIRVKVTGTGNYSGSATSSYAVVQAAGSGESKTALTGVRLSNNAPEIGDTITAAATPTGATATYIWYNDQGESLGSGNSYTVKESDAGHAIYCAAYASGDYTGNVASYYTSVVPVPEQEDIPISGVVVIPESAQMGQNVSVGVNVNCPDYTITWYRGNREMATGYMFTVTQDLAGRNITCVVTAKEGSGYTGSITSNTCAIPPLETTPSGTPDETPSDATAGASDETPSDSPENGGGVASPSDI